MNNFFLANSNSKIQALAKYLNYTAALCSCILLFTTTPMSAAYAEQKGNEGALQNIQINEPAGHDTSLHVASAAGSALEPTNGQTNGQTHDLSNEEAHDQDRVQDRAQKNSQLGNRKNIAPFSYCAHSKKGIAIPPKLVHELIGLINSYTSNISFDSAHNQSVQEKDARSNTTRQQGSRAKTVPVIGLYNIPSCEFIHHVVTKCGAIHVVRYGAKRCKRSCPVAALKNVARSASIYDELPSFPSSLYSSSAYNNVNQQKEKAQPSKEEQKKLHPVPLKRATQQTARKPLSSTKLDVCIIYLHSSEEMQPGDLTKLFFATRAIADENTTIVLLTDRHDLRMHSKLETWFAHATVVSPLFFTYIDSMAYSIFNFVR